MNENLVYIRLIDFLQEVRRVFKYKNLDPETLRESECEVQHVKSNFVLLDICLVVSYYFHMSCWAFFQDVIKLIKDPPK